MDDAVKLEYLVCGEILAPTSINAKEQFFLKCVECDEYFTMLEEFIMHYQYCHNDKFKLAIHSPDMHGADENQEESEDFIEEVKDENEDQDDEHMLVNESQDNDDEENEEEGAEFKDSNDTEDDDENYVDDGENEVDDDEDIQQEDAEDSQEECDDDDDFKDFDRNDSPNNDEDPLDNDSADRDSPDCYNKDQHNADSDNKDVDIDDSDDSADGYSSARDDQMFTTKEETKKARTVVSKFLESESNWKAFIVAYQKIPQLWDPKLFPKRLNNDERNAYLKQIAMEIKNVRNIELETMLVGLTIVRIRQHFRIRLNRFKTPEDRQEAIETNSVPKWYFDALAFLEPSMAHLSIASFDSQRKHLSQEEILQVIQIYQRFPNLWNTNLAENVCFNKRQEALEQMAKAIRREMDLTIKENSLKKYLQSLHAHFTKEKTQLLENREGKNEDPDYIYFEHMEFLNDHVGPFICEFCGRKLKSPLCLKVHIYQSHHRDDPLRCPICHKEYEHVHPYVSHARRHMDDLQDECKECGKKFIRLADLRMHMRTHTGAKPYFCEVCGSSFSKRYSLTEHSRRHEKKYKFFCDICSKGFYEKSHLNRHMTSHSNIRNYSCSICGKAFKTKRHSQIHESTHADVRIFPCPMCGKMFKNKIGVTQHLRTHRKHMEAASNPFYPNLWNTNLVEHVCCNKRQESLEQMATTIHHEMGLALEENTLKDYLEHLHANFAKERSSLHNNKGKKSRNELFYHDHMKFLDDHIGPFVCEFCGRKHKSPPYLKEHIYKTHHQDDPIKCPMCSKKFENAQPYIAHARRHMNDLKDECKVCGKRFIRFADLEMHMRSHTGAKPYVCELCGASYSQRHCLTAHRRRHEKKYKFFCDICSRGYYEKWHLTRHMSRHTNERNYSCSMCGKAFKTKRHAIEHESTHADDPLEDKTNISTGTTSSSKRDFNFSNDDEDDESIGSRNSESASIAREFLQSENNYKSFIAAYKKEPRLWDKKLFPEELNKEDRIYYLQNIATEIKSLQNVELDTNQVTLLIEGIKKEYKNKMSLFKTPEQQAEAVANKSVPDWYFEALDFLKPHLQPSTNPKINSRQKHLKREQILQIISIYKQFPHLWNTSLVECVCINKRQEALEQMSQAIFKKMGLKIKENALKQYLDTMHEHFAKEKSLVLKNDAMKKRTNTLYYEPLKFLNDHVGPFTCSFCGAKKRSPFYFKVHIYQHHHRDDPLRCSICNKEYGKMDPYVVHARRHMNDLRYDCKECGKKYLKPSELRLHMRTHTGTKPYFCEMCGASFTHIGFLNQHKQRRHFKVYRFFCEVCSKGFFNKEERNGHMTVHTNIRNFPCAICGKAFKSKKNLVAHESTHVDGRNFPCPLCGKMFKNKIGVDHHLRTHRKNRK
ncbi:uncharacterized protein [Musca autumnalis]|uniref:uncharacterized protein n=1 Tax=Musca autumnalis TaxID=221902 RepID=UPI003CF6A626